MRLFAIIRPLFEGTDIDFDDPQWRRKEVTKLIEREARERGCIVVHREDDGRRD